MDYKLILPDGYQKPKLAGRDEWVKALRSGEYKQGKAYLCDSGAYCCLGVLCKLQDRQLRGEDVISFDDEEQCLASENPLYDELGSDGFFPKGVEIYIVEARTGSKAPSGLAGCNDSGLTFPQIANIIEAVWDHDSSTPPVAVPMQAESNPVG